MDLDFLFGVSRGVGDAAPLPYQQEATPDLPGQQAALAQQQPDPQPELQPAGDFSFLDDAWDVLAGGATSALTALDTLGRPIRTALATGDIGRAVESVFDPSVASSARDVMETFGVPEFGSANGEWEWGDIPDFLLETAVGIATDPLTFVTFGATGAARQGASAATKAVNLMRKGKLDRVGAANMIEGALGRKLGSEEALTEFLKTRGKVGRLSERVAKGEAGIGLGNPFGDFRFAEKGLPFLAPVVRGIEDAATIGKVALDTATGGVFGRLLRKTNKFFSESSGVSAVDQIGALSNKSNQLLQELQERIHRPLARLEELNLGDEGLGIIRRSLEKTADPEHFQELAKISGLSADEAMAMFHSERGAQSIEGMVEEALKINPNLDKAAAADILQKAVQDIHGVTMDILKNEQATGAAITDLGSGTRILLKQRADKLRQIAVQAGIPPEALQGNLGKAVRDATKNVPDGEAKKLLGESLRQYDEALQIAVTVPGYVPFHATGEAAEVFLKEMRDNPGMARQLADHRGIYHTVESANAAVQAMGTAATANKAIPGTISYGDMAKAWKGGVGLSGKAKAIREAADKGGKLVEDQLIPMLANRLDHMAQVVGAHERGQGIKNVFGEAQPEALLKLYEEEEAFTDMGKMLKRDAKKARKLIKGKKLVDIEKIEKEVLDQLENKTRIVRESMETTGPRLAGSQAAAKEAQAAADIVIGSVKEVKLAEKASTGLSGGQISELDALGGVLADEAKTAEAVARANKGLVSAQKTTLRRLSREQLKATKEYDALLQKALKEKVDQHLIDTKNAIERFGRVPEEAGQLYGKVRASKLGLAKEGKDDFLLPADVARAYQRQNELMRNPRVLSGISRTLSRFNGMWKKLQLAYPGTIARNMMGNIALIAQGGGMTLHTSKDMLNVAKLQFAMRGGKTIEESAKYLDSVKFNVGGKVYGGREMVEQMHSLGVIDSGFFGNELWDLSRALKGKHRIGFIGPKADKGALDYVTAANAFVENNAKMTHFLGRLRQGDSLEEAALSAGTSLFNYRNVSPAINFLRSSGLAPFAAWSGKNIPRQLWLATHKPGQFVAMMHAKQALEEGIPDLTPEQAKAYVNDKLGIRMQTNERGGYDFISLDGILPAADILSFRQAFGSLEEFSEWATNMVGGPIKGGFETMMNRDLYTKQEIKKFDGHAEALQMPWVKNPPSFAVFDPRMLNLARKTIGKPLNLLENFAKWTNEEIDQDTGKPIAFADTNLLQGALLPLRPKRAFSQNDIEIRIKMYKRQISAAKALIKEQNGRNNAVAQTALRSMIDAEARLKEISAPPGQIKKASALPFIL